MIEQIHNTHALSSYNSSSNNHSYEFDNKNKNIKNQIDNKRLSNNNNNNFKMNEILNKYNLISERSSNKESKSISKFKKLGTNSDIQSPKTIKKKNVQIKKNSNNSLIKNNDNISINKNEEQKNNNNLENKKSIIINYKNINRETRYNNIEKFNEEENKNKIKQKRRSTQIIFYQENYNSRNLLRSIRKPQISFITKIYKDYNYFIDNDYDMFSGLRLNVKNNLCFYTKKLIRREEFIKIEKKIKKEKFEKLKKEVEDEKIPTFSSINSSSSNNSTTNLKIKPKTKLKSTNPKKKSKKHKTTKKIISPKKRKLYLPKYNKPIRSISVHSKFSNESSNKNIKRNNKNIQNLKYNRDLIKKKSRKYSIITRLHEKFLTKTKINTPQHKILSSQNLREFNINKKNNLFNINKNIEDIPDIDKKNNENDFKKFLEEQRIKRNNQIRLFMKKQGLTSYNFFYPKEPSPLLSIFKNKYNIYSTLNTNRRSSLEKEEKKDLFKLNKINKKNHISSAIYRHERISLKKLREEQEKEHNKKIKRDINKLHIKEKHYGNEKDCRLCRIFKLKTEKENNNKNNKLFKYDKIRMLSPTANIGYKIMKEFEPISEARIKSANINNNIFFGERKKNFNILYEYLIN